MRPQEQRKIVLTPGGNHGVDHSGVNLATGVGEKMVQDERVLGCVPLDRHGCGVVLDESLGL